MLFCCLFVFSMKAVFKSSILDDKWKGINVLFIDFSNIFLLLIDDTVNITL